MRLGISLIVPSANSPTRCGCQNSYIQIDIRGREGKWVRNIHFVPTWSKSKKLWADYTSNDPGALSSISGTTATEVQDLLVSIWCDELRAEGQTLHYPGKDRDADRIRQLDKLLGMTVDYVAQPFFEQGPCIGLTLGGVAYLPACKVSVLCHGGNRVDQVLEHSARSWSNGQRISLQSRGALNRCPDSVDVTVQLEGAEKLWTKNFKVSSQR